MTRISIRISGVGGSDIFSVDVPARHLVQGINAEKEIFDRLRIFCDA